MEKNLKRFLISLLVVIALVLPISLALGLSRRKTPEAKAYEVGSFEELKATLAEDEPNKEITLMSNLVFGETLNIIGNVTINTAGEFTIKRDAEFDGNIFHVGEGAQLTLSTTASLVFDGENSEKTTPAILSEGELALGEGVEFENFISSERGVVVYNNGTLNMAGAKVHDNALKEGVTDRWGILYNNDGSVFNMTSGEFYQNKASGTGLLFINNNVTASITGGKIYKNQVTGGGAAIIYIKSASANFGAVQIYENTGTYGAVHANNNAVVTIDGAEITRNTATTYGAGVRLDETAQVTLKSGKINDNISTNSGAGVFVDDMAVFTMEGGEIKNNHTTASTANGGGILNKSVTIIKGGVIEGNHANARGGGVHSYKGEAPSNQNPILTITGGSFINNQAGEYGGALSYTSKASISGATFTGNISTNNGGGIYVGTDSESTITGCTFTSNHTNSNGGVCVVDDCTFTSNEAKNGAGLYAFSTSLTIKSSRFNSNTATSNGGAVGLSDTSKVILEGNVLNENSAANGGGLYAQSLSLLVKGTQFLSNTATSNGGGAAFTSTSNVVMQECTIDSNNAKNGGGIWNQSTSLVVNGGTITKNNASSTGTGGGGGIYLDNNKGATADKITLNNVNVTQNTATNRGKDIYVDSNADGDANKTVAIINGGTFGDIGVRYSVLKMGGDVTITEYVKFWSTKKAAHEYLEITKEIEKPFLISAATYAYSVETESSNNWLVRFTADDPWSNIYSQASKISLEGPDGKKDEVFNVVNGKILMQKLTHKITIEGELAIDVATHAANGSQVTFKAFEDYYSISNVKVTYGDNNEVTVSEANGQYSFTMPDADVTITYELTKLDLELVIDESVQGVVSANDTYNFKEDVVVTVLSQLNKKLMTLFVDLGGGKQMEITDTLTFRMFKGARIFGTTKGYHNVSVQQDEKAEVTFTGLEQEQGQYRGYESEQVEFTLSVDNTGDNSRYVLTEVYYLDNNDEKVILTESNGKYTFTMPAYDVEIKFTFEDLLADGQKAVFVGTEEQLNEALATAGKLVVVYKPITITHTISLGHGEFTIIGIKDGALVRDSQFKGDFFVVDFKTTLNLGVEGVVQYSLVIDGNNIEGVNASLITVLNNGILNIYDGVKLVNNIISSRNYAFDSGYGNENCGGGAIFNHFGQVNMFGGEISNNQTTGKLTGAGVFNYGALNLYGGTIKNNTTTEGNGAGVYNGKSLTIEGGTIEGNTITGDGYGAGVYVATSKYAHMFMRSGLIKGNTSPRSGAGLFISSLSSVFINGGTFESNQSTLYNGGAINSRGNLYIYGGEFKNNTAVGMGGAIYQYVEVMAIHGGTFTGNTAANGGAIAFGEGCIATIDGGEFYGNIATNRGGAIYLVGNKELEIPTTVTITGGNIHDNTCKNGAAIAIQYAILQLGGQAQISGDIKLVANTVENYAFIRFISDFAEGTTFTLSPIGYGDADILKSFIRFEGVNPEDLLDNIVIGNADYAAKVEDGHIVVYQREEGDN